MHIFFIFGWRKNINYFYRAPSSRIFISKSSIFSSPPSLMSIVLQTTQYQPVSSLSVQPSYYQCFHNSKIFSMKMYKRDYFLSRLIGTKYLKNNESGISDSYNNHMSLSIILGFYLFLKKKLNLGTFIGYFGSLV